MTLKSVPIGAALGLILFLAGCGQARLDEDWGNQPEDRVVASAFRAAADQPLNAGDGWLAGPGTAAEQPVDQPFRLRIRIEAGSGHPVPRTFALQYRLNDGVWLPVTVSDFPYPETATPPVAVVSTRAYADGTATEPLLGDPDAPFKPGAGMSLRRASPFWAGVETAGEWSWPLVVRRYGDGPVAIEDGDRITFRVIDDSGRALPADHPPALTARLPEGHLGGTFIETPDRIGPWEAANGDLYFLMEPTETDNVFMVVKSTDRGATWHEVDGPNRPAAGDLEGVGSVLVGDTIHILHQTSDAVWHHAFRTSDNPEQPDTWALTDVEVATPPEPPIQAVSLTARPDGSLVGFYAGPGSLLVAQGSADGSWNNLAEIRPGQPLSLSGPVALSDADGTVHLAYTRSDGTAWYRRLLDDGTLTEPRLVSDRLGTEESDWIAFLPPTRDPQSGAVSLIYRTTDGTLKERILRNETMDTTVAVSNCRVVQNAVDSDQVGADVVFRNDRRHLVFIDAETRNIWYTHTQRGGAWATPRVVVEGIHAQWVRGGILSGPEGPVYGIVYDAGSDGGSGFNRFAALPIRE
jgi:hypothetical protein